MHPLYLPARVRFVLRRAHRGHEDGHQDEVTHDHDLRPQAPLAAPRAVVELHAALDAAAVRVVDLVVLPTTESHRFTELGQLLCAWAAEGNRRAFYVLRHASGGVSGPPGGGGSFRTRQRWPDL